MRFRHVNGEGYLVGTRVRLSAAAVPVGLGLGAMLDGAVADPQRHHPVAIFGRSAQRVEARCYGHSKAAGVLAWGVAVAPWLAGAVAVDRVAWRLGGPIAGAAMVAVGAWAAIGSTTLFRVAGKIHAALAADDLAEARRLLPWLVGRDPQSLDADGVARAVIESVAENTSDALTGPIFWGACCGLPGVVGYRLVNTLDAMWGHKNPRLIRFGWWSARTDDLANVLPARVTAAALVLAAPVVAGNSVKGAAADSTAAGAVGGGSAADAVAAWRRDAAKHPSPNAGPVEAAMAGALGVRLGGTNRYGGVVEDRGTLGDGRAVTVADIPRAVRLAQVAAGGMIAGAVCAGFVGRLVLAQWRSGR